MRSLRTIQEAIMPPVSSYVETVKQSVVVLASIGGVCLSGAVKIGGRLDKLIDTDFDDYTDPLASED